MPAQRGEHTRERPLAAPVQGQRAAPRFCTEFQHVPPSMSPRRNQSGVEAGTPDEDEGEFRVPRRSVAREATAEGSVDDRELREPIRTDPTEDAAHRRAADRGHDDQVPAT